MTWKFLAGVTGACALSAGGVFYAVKASDPAGARHDPISPPGCPCVSASVAAGPPASALAACVGGVGVVPPVAASPHAGAPSPVKSAQWDVKMCCED